MEILNKNTKVGQAAPLNIPGPGLLNRLGKMTSIRDTLLLEQSLMKTLGPILGIENSTLYRFDADVLVRALYHHRSKATDADGAERMIEQNEEVFNLGELPADEKNLIASVQALRKSCSINENGVNRIGFPVLIDGDRICGVFAFKRDAEITATEGIVIQGILEVFSNYYQLLDESQRDRLTNLFNRRALENNFDRLWSMPSRVDDRRDDDGVRGEGRRSDKRDRHWLAIIDVDFFKAINDKHGHVIGDEVLLLMSRLLVANLRTSDLVFRFGGEEFVVLFNASDIDAAAVLLQRLRTKIGSHFFPQAGQVTVSAGFIEVHQHSFLQEVLGNADKALYQAKRNGRNRIESYESLVDVGVLQANDYGGMELF